MTVAQLPLGGDAWAWIQENSAPDLRIAFAMPNRWTFQMKPVAEFVQLWTQNRRCIVDPFCGTSTVAHHRNDLGQGGQDAEAWVRSLITTGVRADCVIFDPPYSPRQISECYKSIGREATTEDTQNAGLYRRVRSALADILEPDGIALSFGWQSSGFGKDWRTLQILMVQHGGAHNDTICVAQKRRATPAGRGRQREGSWKWNNKSRYAPQTEGANG